MRSPGSRHQRRVQLIQQLGQLLTKQGMGAGQAAPLVKGGKLEVLQPYADAAGDVVADGLQPPPLL